MNIKKIQKELKKISELKNAQTICLTTINTWDIKNYKNLKNKIDIKISWINKVKKNIING